MTNFADYASVSTEELPEVKLLPIGSYVWTIDRIPETRESSTGSTEMIEFRCRCVGPVENFEGSEDELENFGSPAGEVRIHRMFFPIRPRDDEDQKGLERRQAQALKRINAFLQNDLQAEGDSIKEMLESCVGHQFVGFVNHEADNRDGSMQDRIQSTAPVE